MIVFLTLLFGTILARLFIVKLGIDSFGTSYRMEFESYIIQLSKSIFYYFILILLYVLMA
jgi:hypothetical protein